MYTRFYLYTVLGLGCLLPLFVTHVRGEGINIDETLRATAESSRQISIEVKSSRTIFAVLVNSKLIVNCSSSGGCPPSLHVVVLCQITGRLLDHRSFRTSLYTESMALHPFLESIAPGRILIVGVLADAGLNLPSVSRNLLKNFGISSASFLEFRNYLAAVSVVGGHTLADSISPDIETRFNGLYCPPVTVDIAFVLTQKPSCAWASPDQAKRGRLCLQSVGYGDLCDCSVTAPRILFSLPQPLSSPGLRDTSVLIIAGNRPSSLYRCLHTLLMQPGIVKHKFLVSIDGHYAAVKALLELLEISYVQNSQTVEDFPEDVRNSSGYKISQHYIFSLEHVFERFPDSKKVIVMEEDLLASPDMFDFFSQTSWLLDADHSLYCVSAWNDLGALHTSRDLTELHRVETHPGYGWLMKKSFFESPHVRAERECVIPAVSRTFHYGLTGAHVNGVLTQAHFAGHLMSASEVPVTLRTERLLQIEYEQDLYDLLQHPSTVFLNSTLHPCHHNMLPKNFTQFPLVVAFTMVTSEDYTAWARLGGCHGLWQMDTRGHHRGLFRFHYYNTSVLAIGYPFSEYSWMVPPHVHVVRTFDVEHEQHDLNALVSKNRQRFRVPDLEPFISYLLLEDSSPRPVFLGSNRTAVT
ncbi:Glycosyl transferase family 13 [Trinorchestia longiramus]|nr:Glycosyl transferase family 13 [Trinorchestia longiramus]